MLLLCFCPFLFHSHFDILMIVVRERIKALYAVCDTPLLADCTREMLAAGCAAYSNVGRTNSFFQAKSTDVLYRALCSFMIC